MPSSPELRAAIDVFKELGWHRATPKDAPGLPLGTKEQQRTAKNGLSRGEWEEFTQIANNRYGMVNHVGVDIDMLAAFAIRVGVDARRAARVLRPFGAITPNAIVRLIADRGDAFATRFVDVVSTAANRGWEQGISAFGFVTVALVHELTLPVPDNAEYLKDWACVAHHHLVKPGEYLQGRSARIGKSLIAARYAEHLRAAVAAGVPGRGPLGELIAPGVERRLVGRDETVALTFAALDAAQRPGDRKVWFEALTRDLDLTEDEFLARADELVQAMSLGDVAVIEKVAPILIARGDENSLADVLTVALLAKTKKAKLVVLRAAAHRESPGEGVADAIAPILGDLANGDDPALARAADQLQLAWGIAAAEPLDAEPEIVGRWQPTPDVWDVPRFDIGEVSAAALREAAQVIRSAPHSDYDVDVERYIALAGRLAHVDPDGTREVLREVKGEWVTGLDGPWRWATGAQSGYRDQIVLDMPEELLFPGIGDYVVDPLNARDAAISTTLGDSPTLASTPSWVDLRIDPADLVARIEAFDALGGPVQEADLLVALARLDIRETAEAEIGNLVDRLQATDVPVILQSGERMRRHAGQISADYLRDPIVEPLPTLNVGSGQWLFTWLVPASLAEFPERLAPPMYGQNLQTLFPTWGNAAASLIEPFADATLGTRLRQAARCARPFGPGMAINFLAAQGQLTAAAAGQGDRALQEAWERGLLRPGTADIAYLGWTTDLRGIAAFAATCREIAQAGLLSVVWPVLDDLAGHSAQASRVLAGTVELIAVCKELLPAVRSAVAAGIADPQCLEMPGLRSLASKPGSSRAVVAARALVADLPAPKAADQIEGSSTAAGAVVDPLAGGAVGFEELWPEGAGAMPAVDDGGALTVYWGEPRGTRRRLVTDISWPQFPAQIFRIDKSWFYDLEMEGQCEAEAIPVDQRAGQPSSAGALPSGSVWLRWDAKAAKITVADQRHADQRSFADLRTVNNYGPLTTSMVAVILAALCNDDDSKFYARSLISSKLMGAEAVRVAVRALLDQPDVSPARIAGVLEKSPAMLPVLWPLLIESVAFAAAVDDAPPKWLGRVLAVAIHFAPYLREAARRGLISATDAPWAGLTELSARPGKSATLAKARELRALLGLE